MKSKNKERRVINIDKKDFDFIKLYCELSNFNMSKWLVSLAFQHILLEQQQLEEKDYKSENLPNVEDVIKKRFGSKEFREYVDYAKQKNKGRDMKKTKSKNKQILLVGVHLSYFKTEKDRQDYCDKAEKVFRDIIGLKKEKLPIIIYDKGTVDVSLLEIKD